MHVRNAQDPGNLGPPVPEELLRRSRVARFLWAHRGTVSGTSLTELCALCARTEAQALGQVSAALRYLRKRKSAWSVLSEVRETEEGAQERYFWLVAPHCPRPAPRVLPELGEPDFISWDEVESAYPLLPRWA